MSDGPLVYFAARCSGGTAIHAILRDLLLLHGVRLFAAPHLGYSAELIQSRHGPDALTRFHAQAANRSETLLFSVHAAETLENVSRTLHGLGAAVVHTYRANALDRILCSIRDCIADKDYGLHLGDAVFSNGTASSLCYDRANLQVAPGSAVCTRRASSSGFTSGWRRATASSAPPACPCSSFRTPTCCGGPTARSRA